MGLDSLPAPGEAPLAPGNLAADDEAAEQSVSVNHGQ